MLRRDGNCRNVAAVRCTRAFSFILRRAKGERLQLVDGDSLPIAPSPFSLAHHCECSGLY